MRTGFAIAMLGAALAASPALAQIGVGVGVGADAEVGVDAGSVIRDVDRTVDRTVDRADRRVNRTLSEDLVLATHADLRSGVAVRDSSGRRVGTVQSVHGDGALVVQGNRRMHVPLAALYRSGSGLVTSLSRAELRAAARAEAQARANR